MGEAEGQTERRLDFAGNASVEWQTNALQTGIPYSLPALSVKGCDSVFSARSGKSE